MGQNVAYLFTIDATFHKYCTFQCFAIHFQFPNANQNKSQQCERNQLTAIYFQKTKYSFTIDMNQRQLETFCYQSVIMYERTLNMNISPVWQHISKKFNESWKYGNKFLFIICYDCSGRNKGADLGRKCRCAWHPKYLKNIIQNICIQKWDALRYLLRFIFRKYSDNWKP